MFEKATRRHLRFAYKGMCSVEDLWDLHVEELDKIYSKLRAEQKASNEDSLLQKPTAEAGNLSLRVEIVKHIVATKLAEAEARKVQVANKAKKQRIMELIAQKEDQSLAEKSVEELQQLVNEL